MSLEHRLHEGAQRFALFVRLAKNMLHLTEALGALVGALERHLPAQSAELEDVLLVLRAPVAFGEQGFDELHELPPEPAGLFTRREMPERFGRFDRVSRFNFGRCGESRTRFDVEIHGG